MSNKNLFTFNWHKNKRIIEFFGIGNETKFDFIAPKISFFTPLTDNVLAIFYQNIEKE
jgi:hypothetical protein